jgi:hypothetical protein
MTLFGQAKQILTSICNGETKHIVLSDNIRELGIAINRYLNSCDLDSVHLPSDTLTLFDWCVFMRKLLKYVYLPENEEDLKDRLLYLGIDYNTFVKLDTLVGIEQKVTFLNDMDKGILSLFLEPKSNNRRRVSSLGPNKRAKVTESISLSSLTIQDTRARDRDPPDREDRDREDREDREDRDREDREDREDQVREDRDREDRDRVRVREDRDRDLNRDREDRDRDLNREDRDREDRDRDLHASHDNSIGGSFLSPNRGSNQTNDFAPSQKSGGWIKKIIAGLALAWLMYRFMGTETIDSSKNPSGTEISIDSSKNPSGTEISIDSSKKCPSADTILDVCGCNIDSYGPYGREYHGPPPQHESFKSFNDRPDINFAPYVDLLQLDTDCEDMFEKRYLCKTCDEQRYLDELKKKYWQTRRQKQYEYKQQQRKIKETNPEYIYWPKGKH